MAASPRVELSVRRLVSIVVLGPMLVLGMHAGGPGFARSQAAAERMPVPDAKGLQDSQTLFEEVYGAEIKSAQSGPQQADLARELLEQAKQTPESAPRYVLFKEAGNLFVQAADAESALQVVDAMGKQYAIEAGDMKAKVLEAIAKKVRSAEQARLLTALVLRQMEAAAQQDDYANALRMGAAAGDAARKSRDRELRKEAADRTGSVKKLADAYSKVADALVALASDPRDPAANLALGRFYCFLKGDWTKGLPYLAAGGDSAVPRLAAQDLLGGDAPEAQLSLADQWWDLGDGEPAARQRAAYWYRRALPRLAGMEKTKAEQRLALVGDSGDGADAASSERVPLVMSDPDTQPVMAAGVDWLVKHQRPDGSWTLMTPPHPGSDHLPCTATGLALIALMRAGHTHEQGEHRQVVRGGLTYLTRSINAGGAIGTAIGGSLYCTSLSMVTLGLCADPGAR